MPEMGERLVGWRVMSYFERDHVWFEGVIVQHQGDAWFTVFYEVDDEHEDWGLPDAELVFMCACEAGHMVEVTRGMLPRLGVS